MLILSFIFSGIKIDKNEGGSVMSSDLQANQFYTVSRLNIVLGIIVILVGIGWSYWLAVQYEQYVFGFIAVIGGLFGIVLQRSRFCFYCILTDFFERRDARGIAGLFIALLVGTLGYHAVFGAFLPQLDGQQLPPDAHIGAVSGVLVIGAISFGLGMAFAGSCISAQLYRIGEGLITAPIALLGVLIGFGLGFLTWNQLYLGFMQEAKPLWLPNMVGYAGSLLIQILLIATVLVISLYFIHRQRSNSHSTYQNESIVYSIFQQRWPTWVGGVLIGLIATIAYFRVGALGVTAELGSISRTLLSDFTDISRLEGLDRLTGCMTVVKETVLSNNGVFVLSLIVGSFASALLAGQFKIQTQNLKGIFRIFFGGILMGWGAMVSLGCTVGVFLSGIMAGAVSGWIFAIFCVFGAWLGWKIRQTSA